MSKHLMCIVKKIPLYRETLHTSQIGGTLKWAGFYNQKLSTIEMCVTVIVGLMCVCVCLIECMLIGFMTYNGNPSINRAAEDKAT